MIKQIFDINDYWQVVVYYDIDFHLFNHIAKDLSRVGASVSDVEEVYNSLMHGKAKAVTFSNTVKHRSIVLFNKHYSKEDYINSIVHEAEHIKQAMLRAYQVEDTGEPPAYTIGYLVSQMYRVFSKIICTCENL